MIIKIIKYIDSLLLRALLLLAVCGSTNIFAQIGQITNEKTKATFNAYFIKRFVEVTPPSSIFNILIVKNNSSENKIITIKFSYPEQWSFIGVSIKNITLVAGDSAIVPVRLSVSSNTHGGVANVIGANIVNEKDEVIASAFSYANIKKNPDIRISNISNTYYIRPNQDATSCSFRIQNKGNIHEIVSFDFDSPNSMLLEGSIKNKFSKSYNIPPFSDTVLTFNVLRSSNNNYIERMKGLQKIQVNIFNKDSRQSNTILFKTLESYYINKFSSLQNPLSFDLRFGNLFSKGLPSIYLSLYGTTLLNPKGDIYYFFRNQGASLIEKTNIYNYVIQLGYKTDKLDIQIGDITKAMFYYFMKGIAVDYKLKQFKISMYGSGRNDLNIYNAGLGLNYLLKNNINLNASVDALANNGLTNKLNYRYDQFGISLYNFKRQTISVSLLHSIVQQQQHKSPEGYGIGFNYGISLNHLKINTTNLFCTSNFVSRMQKEPSSNNINATYTINEKSNIRSDYDYRKYLLYTLFNNAQDNQEFDKYQNGYLTYSHTLNPSLILRTGTRINNLSTNRFNNFDSNNLFSTVSYYWVNSLSIHPDIKNLNITPSFEIGETRLLDYPDSIKGIYTNSIPNIKNRLRYINGNAGINFKFRYLLLMIKYYHGPTTLGNINSLLLSNNFSKQIRINTSYKRFIYEDQVEMLTGVNFLREMVNSTSRFYVNNTMNWYMRKYWTLSTNLSISVNSNKNKIEEKSNISSSAYFEFGIRKDFNWQQPRYKFYNLQAIFFIDYNGDRIKNENEPGIENMLVKVDFAFGDSITQDPSMKYFNSVELITDQQGKIIYERIPKGTFALKYKLLDKMESGFHAASDEINVNINNNTTIYIPFFENNTIYGELSLKRDRFSSLGNINLKGIRVVAKDTMGNSWSTLTNEEGKFILSVPRAGHYTVTVNNILYQNFNLEQNNYLIDFNGYKQFKLSFIFIEKERKVNFNLSNADTSKIKSGSMTGITPSLQKGVNTGLQAPSTYVSPITGSQAAVYNARQRDSIMRAQAAAGIITGNQPNGNNQQEQQVNNTPQNPQQQNTTQNNTVTKARYYVMAGAYKNRNTAELQVEELKARGFDKALLVGRTEDGLYRICYTYSETNRGALQELSKIRKNVTPFVWLLEQNTKANALQVSSMVYEPATKLESADTAVNPFENGAPLRETKKVEPKFEEKKLPKVDAIIRPENTSPEVKDTTSAITPSDSNVVTAPIAPTTSVDTTTPATIPSIVIEPTPEITPSIDTTKTPEVSPEIQDILNEINNTSTTPPVDTAKIINDIKTYETQTQASDSVAQAITPAPPVEEPKTEPAPPTSELPESIKRQLGNLQQVPVNEPGTVYKVQFEANDLMLNKHRGLSGLPDLVRIQGENDPTKLYFMETFFKFEDAKDYKNALKELGLPDVDVVPFKDGQKITLQEAGVQE